MREISIILVLAILVAVFFVFIEDQIREKSRCRKIKKLKANDQVDIITYEGQKRCIIKYIGERQVHYTIIGDHEMRHMVADVEDIIV